MTKEDNCIFNVFSGIECQVNLLEADALKILERLEVFENSDSPAAVFDGELWEALHDMLVRTSILIKYINNPDEKHTVKKGEFDPTKLPNALLVRKAYNIVQKIPDLMPFGRIYNMDAFNENCDKLRLLFNDRCVEKLPGDGDMRIEERTARALDELRKVKLMLSYTYTQIVRLSKSDVDNVKVSEQDIFAEIDRTFRKFSTKFRDECYGQLNQKPKVAGSWVKVCEDEREMYSLILEDESNFMKDKRFKLYDKRLKEGILDNKPLIEALSKINIDGKLWFGDKWTDYSVDMTEVYEALNTDNFLIFCKLALRHNLIQCEVYPELKAKFEAWLKGVAYDMAVKATVKAWKEDLKKYVIPLKEYFKGRDYEGLWDEILSENDNLTKSNRGVDMLCFEPRNSVKGTYDKVMVWNIIGRMCAKSLFGTKQYVEIAKALEKSYRPCAQQISFGAQNFKNSTLTDDSKKKIDEIIGKYVLK